MRNLRPGYPVGRDVPIERKVLFWFLLACALVLLFLSPLAVHAQERSNTFFVSEFKGADVGTKITAAQASCSANTSIPCVIVVDAILAVWPQGSIPARCAQCIWLDYRSPTFTALPFTISPGTSIVLNGATSGTVTQTAPAVAGTQTVTWPAASGTPLLDTATQTSSNKTFPSPTITGTVGGGAAYTIGTTLISEAPRMTFGATVIGAVNPETAGVVFSRFIPDKAITVTRVTVVAFVAQAGATTNPQFQVTDGTTVAATITVGNGSTTLDSGPITANYAAGANVDFKCSTTQAGTTTFPSFNVIVEYRMQ